MIGEKPKGLRAHLTLLYPSLMLGIFFIVPFGLMTAVSFFHRQPGGFYVTGFELTNYQNLYTALFGRTLLFSLFVAGLSAAVCVCIGFPFTYFITRMKRRAQVVWLVLLMSVLSLSEVIVGFAWSLLLSRTAGLSNLLVWIGLMERPVAWYPGFAALRCFIHRYHGLIRRCPKRHKRWGQRLCAHFSRWWWAPCAMPSLRRS
jgi:putative spermidine/putrescine transport system permease protein